MSIVLGRKSGGGGGSGGGVTSLDGLSGAVTLSAGTGITLTPAGQDIEIASSASFPQPSTTFPGSPSDGDLALIVDSTSAPTYSWMFRYDSGISGNNKWQCIGGAPKRAYVGTDQASSSTSYTDLATVGPSVTVPSPGVYQVVYGCALRNSAVNGTRMAMKFGASAVTEDGLIYSDVAAYRSLASTSQESIAAGNLLIKAQYRVDAGDGNWQKRWITVVPIAVEG